MEVGLEMATDHPPANDRTFLTRTTEATIHVGLVVLLAYWCFHIFQPFFNTIVWGIIIAVATHPVYHRLRSSLGGRSKLAAATVRSVTQGILGVALIQSILSGLGCLVAGVPGAGLWALLVLLLAVVQLPSLLVLGPIIIYVFSTASTVTAVLFMVWSLFVGLSDNFLKPILLGRGVQVPMVVIFIGAIGGFITSGIIGLFVGATILTLGYKLFLAWLQEGDETSEEPGKSVP